MGELPRVTAPQPGPLARGLAARFRQAEGTASKAAVGPDPMAFAAARGALLEDVDGNTYLDMAGSYAVATIGHCHPRVVQAIAEQAAQIMHVPSNYLTPGRVELAEALVRRAPTGLDAVQPAMSGTEAGEMAIKFAAQVTGGSQVVSFYGSYFGRSHAALALSGQRSLRFGLRTVGTPPATFLPYPYCLRCPLGLSRPSCGLACLELVQSTLLNPASGLGSPACVMLEAVQGSGGQIVPPDGWLQGVAEICREAGVPLVVDEVQTGFGRTGRLWAVEHWQVTPDLLTVGKTLGGGLPLAAVLGRRSILGRQPPGLHTSTFITNPLLMAAGRAVLAVIDEEKLVERARILGAKLLRELQRTVGPSPVVAEVRGLGMMLGIEIVRDRATLEPDADGTRWILEQCRRQGLLMVASGWYHNVIKLSPPVTIAENQLDYAAGVLAEVIARWANRPS